MRGDRGAAAVEFALVLTMLMALLALVAPLAVLFYSRIQLGQAAGEVARFATSRSDVGREAGPLTIRRGMLPSQAAVEQELLRFSSPGAIALHSLPPRTPDPHCPSGWRREVVLSTTVDLGPAGAVFAGLTGAGATKTLLANASSCEE